MGNSYELWLKPLVRYRIEPAPVGWMADSDGWRTNIWQEWRIKTWSRRFTPAGEDRRLWLTDRAIQVEGADHPARRSWTDPFWIDSPLTPQQTTMRTVRLPSKWTIHASTGNVGPYLFPWPKVKFLALSSPLPDDSELTLAIRPLDGQLDRVSEALRNVGVRES